MFDRDADLDEIGKREAGKKPAIALDDQSDDRTDGGIEQSGLDEQGVHRRVEKLVIGDIVEMAVRIVVLPARRNPDESREGGAIQRGFASGGGCRRAQASLPRVRPATRFKMSTNATARPVLRSVAA